jgi:hypothetical protein
LADEKANFGGKFKGRSPFYLQEGITRKKENGGMNFTPGFLQEF